MKKEGSKREHGPTFCFDFWVRFGDHRALYHIPIVIIPTLGETNNHDEDVTDLDRGNVREKVH